MGRSTARLSSRRSLALGLLAARQAQFGQETVVPSEVHELGVPLDLLRGMGQGHSLHVVVEDGGGDPTEEAEGVDVALEQGSQILGDSELQVEHTAVAEGHDETPQRGAVAMMETPTETSPVYRSAEFTAKPGPALRAPSQNG